MWVYGSALLLIGLMLGPPLTVMCRDARDDARGENVMHQLVLSCMVYANDDDGIWPATLDGVRAYALPNSRKASVPKATISSFSYIRPSVQADSGQPVVIDNSAGHPDDECQVVYADGHIGLVKGLRIREVACRLAASAKASGPGIDLADWPSDLPGVEIPSPAVLPAKTPPGPAAR